MYKKMKKPTNMLCFDNKMNFFHHFHTNQVIDFIIYNCLLLRPCCTETHKQILTGKFSGNEVKPRNYGLVIKGNNEKE